tara:strand:+ start:24733 stop:25098 length:366 start_codon:yes stop_codon:yes gene_type:complete
MDIMAYDRKELEKKALAAIKEHKLMFVEHIVAFLPCGKTTFYELKLNESNSIKKAIEKMRISKKTKMLSKWIDSEIPSLQIAAMKIISEEYEAHRLNGTRQEIKHEGGIKSTLIEWKPAKK